MITSHSSILFKINIAINIMVREWGYLESCDIQKYIIRFHEKIAWATVFQYLKHFIYDIKHISYSFNKNVMIQLYTYSISKISKIWYLLTIWWFSISVCHWHWPGNVIWPIVCENLYFPVFQFFDENVIIFNYENMWLLNNKQVDNIMRNTMA